MSHYLACRAMHEVFRATPVLRPLVWALTGNLSPLEGAIVCMGPAQFRVSAYSRLFLAARHVAGGRIAQRADPFRALRTAVCASASTRPAARGQFDASTLIGPVVVGGRRRPGRGCGRGGDDVASLSVFVLLGFGQCGPGSMARRSGSRGGHARPCLDDPDPSDRRKEHDLGLGPLDRAASGHRDVDSQITPHQVVQFRPRFVQFQPRRGTFYREIPRLGRICSVGPNMFMTSRPPQIRKSPKSWGIGQKGESLSPTGFWGAALFGESPRHGRAPKAQIVANWGILADLPTRSDPAVLHWSYTGSARVLH